jgi:hypothetical protein
MILIAFYVCCEIIMTFMFDFMRGEVKKEFYAFAIIDALLYVLSCTTDLYKHNIIVHMYWLYWTPFITISFTLLFLFYIVMELFYFMCDKVDGLYDDQLLAHVARNTRAAAAAAA